MKWGITKNERRNGLVTPLDLFRSELDSVFDNYLRLEPVSLFESRWLPALDVTEGENLIQIIAEIPGINSADLQVTVENNVLTISGEKKEEHKEEKNRVVVTERSFGSFSRSVKLPDNVNAEEIKGKFDNGVLTIEIPINKKNENNKVKIDIK